MTIMPPASVSEVEDATLLRDGIDVWINEGGAGGDFDP